MLFFIALVAIMIWNTMLSGVYVILWNRFGIIGAILTKYEVDEKYSNKKCSAKITEDEFFAPSVLSCLASTATAGASIYNRQNKLCYSIKSGYQFDECSADMVGARMYVKENMAEKKTEHKKCPDGWVFLHVSCYKPVEQTRTRTEMSDTCKTFSKTAHLADIKSAEELAQIRAWLLSTYGKVYQTDIMSVMWLGLTYDSDWKWSDGSPVVYQNWKTIQPKNPDKGACMCSVNQLLKWRQISCDTLLNGLCELDIF